MVNQSINQSNKVDILGIGVNAVTMQDVVSVSKEVINNKSQMSIIAVNPEKIIRSKSNLTLKNCLQSVEMLIPDGIGAVLAARILYGSKIGRVAGADLMPELCKMASQEDFKVFLFGAKEHVNQGAAESIKERFPRLKIAGRQNGYVNDEDTAELLDEINQSGAHILFVALGSPAQELWIEKNRSKLNVNVFQGVGGTFDVLSGKVVRAPRLFINMQLEWFYRLITDPRRLWRQRVLPVFAFKVLLTKFKITD